MGCATGIVKFVMFLFNFFFVVGGILMVVAGSFVLTGYKGYQDVVEVDLVKYKAPPILLICVGSAIFLVSFMGCCGVLRESNCMMMTYAVFLTIILIVQVGIAVGAHVYQDDFKDLVNQGLNKSMTKYDSIPKVKESFDLFQRNLKCCGPKSYQDWKIRNDVPDSCCKEEEVGCARGLVNEDKTTAAQKIYTEGCTDKVFEAFKLKYVVISAAVIAGIELLGIMFSCCLAARFRRKEYA